MPNRKTIGNYTRAKLEEIIRRNAGGPTIEDIDGAPSVVGVKTIKVSNGTLTDDGVGVVTLNTSGGAGTVLTKRFIIEATACTEEATAQNIAIYTKTADEGISNVRVRWGSTKFNYGGGLFYFGVGFFPDGGSLDDDSMVLVRDIANVLPGAFAITEYYTKGGVVWGPYGYWNLYMHSTLAHYQEAGDVYIRISLATGEVVDLDVGTIEVFLDITVPGDGTIIS